MVLLSNFLKLNVGFGGGENPSPQCFYIQLPKIHRRFGTFKSKFILYIAYDKVVLIESRRHEGYVLRPKAAVCIHRTVETTLMNSSRTVSVALVTRPPPAGPLITIS